MRGVEEIDPYLLSVLFAHETGLPVTVWARARDRSPSPANLLVATSAGDRVDMYDAAVVALRPAFAMIKGSLAFEVIDAVERWVNLNNIALLDHWDGQTDSADLIRSLIPLSHPASPAHPGESRDPVLE